MDISINNEKKFGEADFQALAYDISCLIEAVKDEKYKIEVDAIEAITSHTLLFLEHLICKGRSICAASSTASSVSGITASSFQNASFSKTNTTSFFSSPSSPSMLTASSRLATPPLLLADHIVDALKNDIRKYNRCKNALENYRVIQSMITAYDDMPYIANNSNTPNTNGNTNANNS